MVEALDENWNGQKVIAITANSDSSRTNLGFYPLSLVFPFFMFGYFT
jgi:hypothetical protein